MNTEQRSIPTKPINERTVALVTAVAALLIGGLPGTAYSGQYLNDYLKDRGWTGLAFSLYHGPEEQKYPNGERSVVECWGSNCVQNYDQCHCFVTFWDERGNVEYQEEWWGDKRAQTTYDDKGKSTTVIGDPSTGSKEVIIKDFDGVVISDTTYTFDHLGNIKTATAKDKCGTITSQVTCTYTYDDKGVASRLCKDEHGVEKHFDPSTLGLAGVPDGNGPAGSGRGQAGQVGSPGGVGIGNTQAIAPDSASAIGGPAGVVGTNAAVVRHPGQSIKGLKPAQGVAAPSGSSGTAGGSRKPRDDHEFRGLRRCHWWNSGSCRDKRYSVWWRKFGIRRHRGHSSNADRRFSAGTEEVAHTRSDGDTNRQTSAQTSHRTNYDRIGHACTDSKWSWWWWSWRHGGCSRPGYSHSLRRLRY